MGSWIIPSVLVRINRYGWKCVPNRMLATSGKKSVIGNVPAATSVTGLFDCPEFSTPSQFALESHRSIQRSRRLVEEIVEIKSFDIAVIDKMDLLSDELCRVADLAECIRLVHPDKQMAMAAEKACLKINAYVEELNTNVGLYAAVHRITQDSKFSSLDRVTQRTSMVLMHDFKASGIFLEESTRRKVVELTGSLLKLGYKYVNRSTQPSWVEKGQSPDAFSSHYEQAKEHYAVDCVLYYNRDRELRKHSYLQYYRDEPEQLRTFESLMENRQELANLVGYKSFPHRVLKLSMAESPETVTDFLECLSEKILPLALEDAEMLKQLGGLEDIGPWDVPFLQKKYMNGTSSNDVLESIRNWFPLDACIGGLANLFKSLFGISLEVAPVKKGEVWHSHVMKFNFIDEDLALIGCTYADLIERDDKSAGDCHFTIRGGREKVFGFPGKDSVVCAPHRGYQLPIITLCCNMEKPGATDEQWLLSRHAVETLFHEMGHALHSMLCRAKYQNVTGTRCSTDYAEVPSTLMELFLYDHRIIASFAKHNRTGKPLPSAYVEAFQSFDDKFLAIDTQTQIYYAFLDQKLHAVDAGVTGSGWSTKLFREVTEKYSPLNYVPQTSYYLRFPHLSGYGGRYYSYLWSKAVASLIWKSFFQDDPFSRESGEKYRVMLSEGGGASPRELVQDLLGFDPSVSDLVDTLYTDIMQRRGKAKQGSMDF